MLESEQELALTTPALFRAGDICLIDQIGLICHPDIVSLAEIRNQDKKVKILGQNHFGRYVVAELGNPKNRFTVDARLLVLLKGIEERKL